MSFNRIYILAILIVSFSCNENRGELGLNPGSSFSLEEKSNEKYYFVLQDSLVLIPKQGLFYFKGELFSGLAKSFYPSGILAEEIQYKNGKKQGFYKKYFRNGQLSFSAQYVNAKRNGLSTSWWSNGNIRSESNFLEGKPSGVQKQWYKSGAKFKILNLLDGHEEGKQQSWRENGKIYSNYQAINGRIFGLKRANLCYKLEDEEVQSKD